MATKRPASSEPEPEPDEEQVVEKEVEKREGEGKEVVEGKDGEGKKISEGGAVEAQEKEKEQGVKIPKSKRPKTLATKTKRPTVEEEGKKEKEKEKEKVEEVVVKSPKSKKSKTHVTATKQPTAEEEGKGEKVEEVVVKSPDKKSKTQPQTKQPTAEVEGNGEELKKPKAQIPKTKQPTTEKTLPIDLTKKKSEKRKEKDDGDSVVEEKEAKKKKALPFRRVWSEEDEVSILKGYLEHIKEGGDMNGLFDSIKMSLNAVDFSKEQLNDKVRKMKKKCLENAKKEAEGVALEFSKPHDSELYELSKKVWNPLQSGKGVDSAGPSGVKRSSRIRKAAAAAGDTPICGESVDEKEKEKEKEPIYEESENEKKQEQIVVGAFNLLNELMHSEKGKDLIRPPLSLGEGFLGLGWVGKSEKVKAMDEKWKNLKIAEGEVFLEKLALMKERTELGLEALRGSSSNA